jgi:hypothetical protein
MARWNMLGTSSSLLTISVNDWQMTETHKDNEKLHSCGDGRYMDVVRGSEERSTPLRGPLGGAEIELGAEHHIPLIA